MICYPFPHNFPQTFTTLLHLTTMGSAVAILRTGKIFGNDICKHANFSVKWPRRDIARGDEVLLTFEFRGQHAAYFGSPGHSTPYCQGLAQPIAFHIFTDGPPHDWPQSNLLNINYWQTNLYPGTNGLYLKNARLLEKPSILPKAQKTIWPWQSEEYRNQLVEVCMYAKRIRVLDKLRSRANGKHFSVP